MYLTGKTVKFVCITVMLLSVIAEVSAQQADKELLDRVRTLEERVKTLEKGVEKDPRDFRVYWQEGLRFATDDGQFKMRLGGRTAVDWAWFSQDRELEEFFGNQQDGVEFRRAYLYASGLVDGWVEFKSEYDFSSGGTGFEDVYVGFTNLPYFGRIRIGHFDEPFGLELRTSNRFPTFMERALTHAMVPGTETGVLAKNLVLNDRLFWGAGVFRDGDGTGSSSDDGGHNVTGRMAVVPVYADEGKKLVHLGAAYSHRNPDETVRFRSRPESHLSSFRYVDTGDIPADTDDRLGLEFACIRGPLSIQAEHVLNRIDVDGRNTAEFSAFYAYLSWFLTGESRNYDRGGATFDRTMPNKNFRGKDGGPGAWEVAARFSHIDLDHGVFRGGKEDDVTLGLNWYLNPNTKLMLNYVHGEVDHDMYDGDIDIVQMRAQIDF